MMAIDNEPTKYSAFALNEVLSKRIIFSTFFFFCSLLLVNSNQHENRMNNELDENDPISIGFRLDRIPPKQNCDVCAARNFDEHKFDELLQATQN